MRHFIAAAVSVAACVAVQSAVATDRYFPDITAYSPGKKFRLEAKSPDNAGERPRPFAAKFVYALYDETTKAKLWERKQPMTKEEGGFAWPDKEYSPTAVYLTDKGDVVIVTGQDQVVSLAAADGAKLGQIGVLEQFPKTDRKAYVSETTAGPRWHQHSRWSFLETKDDAGAAKLYFVVRPYWERRVVMDVATGKLVDLGEAALGDKANAKEPWQGKLVEAILKDEESWALATLKAAAKDPPGYDQWAPWWDIATAAVIAGRRGVKDAAPALRELAQMDQVTSSSSTGTTIIGLRQTAHTALRRLGQTPAGEPAIALREADEQKLFEFGDELTSTVQIKDRAKKADEVKEGMTAKAMVAAIGLPDYEVFDPAMGHALDYDVDVAAPGEPFTLRVSLKGKQVEKVKKISPAVWKEGFERERGR